MNEIMFTVLESVMSLAILLIVRHLIPYLKLKARALVNESVWDIIVKEVKSVEQTIKGSGLGKTKKEEVLARIVAWTTQHGIAITQEQISQLIETAVFIMNNEDKKNGSVRN